jgi:acyl-CoA synthetase (NDP forming)/RimJ/RimL family protein N-acetyltransferase
VVLRDGSVAHVRPITPDDADGIREFHAGQSDESIYMRFFAPLRELSNRDVERFTVVDYDDRVALVVTLRGKIIGIGRYDKVNPVTAEVAFNISDHYQGKGIGSVLLEHLAAIGHEAGLTRFVAEVLPRNRKMLNVFTEAGYHVNHRLEDGIVVVTFDITPTAQSTQVRIAREHRAEALSVRGVLTPASVAVIGASRREQSVGHTLLRNLLAGEFTGPVYAVNPTARSVLGLRCYPSVLDVPDQVDLAIICVPASQVLDVVERCAAKEVRTILVPAANFAETGEAGLRLQQELGHVARREGMRVVGPNSFGIINNDADVRLNASFAPQLPPRGTLALFAQSGALGITVLASATRRNLGISVFASAGNRVDVSGNDFMQYWIDDDDTDAVGLYLETLGNPRKFTRIARHLSTSKPLIVVKSGISPLSVPTGHAVPVTTVRPEALDAMLHQTGAIRADNIHQLFDIAQLVVHQPLPAGDRVGIVGNSHALGTLSAQAVQNSGLKLAHDAVSLAPEVGADEFAVALRAAFDDPDVDSVLALFVPPVLTADGQVAKIVRDEAARSTKTCVATFLSMRGVTEALSVGDPTAVRRRVVPAYTTPEDAIRALAAATQYAQWRARDHGAQVAPIGIDHDAAEALIEGILRDEPEGRVLSQRECAALLATHGIDLWQSVVVQSADEAVEAAHRVGFPVILKVVSPLRRQLGVGGIRLDLNSDEAVREAWASLTHRLGALASDRFAVQHMSPPGVECVLSTTEDPLFGPVVAFSVAGPPTDLLGDIGYRIPPLTDVDARDLVQSVRAAPLLVGHGGKEPIHLEFLCDLVSRLSVLADEHPDLASVSLNPVNCWGAGVDILGAQISVAPALERIDSDRRVMS